MYYNTNGLGQPQLAEARATAARQDDLVLSFFERNAPRHIPASVCYSRLLETGELHEAVPLTSVRRAISNLCKAGKLTKLSATRPGPFGKPEHLFTFTPREAMNSQPSYFDAFMAAAHALPAYKPAYCAVFMAVLKVSRDARSVVLSAPLADVQSLAGVGRNLLLESLRWLHQQGFVDYQPCRYNAGTTSLTLLNKFDIQTSKPDKFKNQTCELTDKFENQTSLTRSNGPKFTNQTCNESDKSEYQTCKPDKFEYQTSNEADKVEYQTLSPESGVNWFENQTLSPEKSPRVGVPVRGRAVMDCLVSVSTSSSSSSYSREVEAREAAAAFVPASVMADRAAAQTYQQTMAAVVTATPEAAWAELGGVGMSRERLHELLLGDLFAGAKGDAFALTHGGRRADEFVDEFLTHRAMNSSFNSRAGLSAAFSGWCSDIIGGRKVGGKGGAYGTAGTAAARVRVTDWGTYEAR